MKTRRLTDGWIDRMVSNIQVSNPVTKNKTE